MAASRRIEVVKTRLGEFDSSGRRRPVPTSEIRRLECDTVILLKPLPFPQADRLVGLWHTAKGLNMNEVNICPSMYFTYREQARSFTDIGAYTGGWVSVSHIAEPEQVQSLFVTDGVLPILGVSPAAAVCLHAATTPMEAPAPSSWPIVIGRTVLPVQRRRLAATSSSTVTTAKSSACFLAASNS